MDGGGGSCHVTAAATQTHTHFRFHSRLPGRRHRPLAKMTARAPHSILARQRGHSSPGTSVPRRHFSTCLQGKLSSGV